MKKIIAIITLLTGLFINTITVSAADITNDTILNENSTMDVNIEIEDAQLKDAQLIESYSYVCNDKITYVENYELEDGTLVTDTFTKTYYDDSTRSSSGSDEATRTRTISGKVIITITAKFSWYTKTPFSYVKCDSMSASYTLLNNNIVNSQFDKSSTTSYVSIGKATAEVEYYFYNKTAPMEHNSGTFKITCTDTGTISDNG